MLKNINKNRPHRFFCLTLSLFLVNIAHATQENVVLEPETATLEKQFKKPSNMDEKTFLKLLLHRTKLANDVSENDLAVYANTIRALCKKSPDLLKTEIENKTSVLDYSLKYCYPLIDGVLIESQRQAEKSVQSHPPIYQPRTQEQKEQTTKCAKECSIELVRWLKTIDVLKNVIPESTTENTYTYTPTSKLLKGHTVSLSLTKAKFKACLLEITIKNNSNESVGFIIVSIEQNPLKKRSEIYVASLKIKSFLNRQKGLGTALLSTILELAKSLKSDIKLSLAATPENQTMLPTLIKYYKEFGFRPKAKSYTYQKLYIDKNGTIIKPFAMADYRKKRQQIMKDEYLETLNKKSTEVIDFIKNTNLDKKEMSFYDLNFRFDKKTDNVQLDIIYKNGKVHQVNFTVDKNSIKVDYDSPCEYAKCFPKSAKFVSIKNELFAKLKTILWWRSMAPTISNVLVATRGFFLGQLFLGISSYLKKPNLSIINNIGLTVALPLTATVLLQKIIPQEHLLVNHCHKKITFALGFLAGVGLKLYKQNREHCS